MKKLNKYLLVIMLSLFIIPIISVNVNAATLNVKTINASITDNKISVDGTVNNSNNNTTNTETSNKVDNTTNPKTGDNIILYGIMFIVAYYIQTNFNTEKEFNTFAQTIKKRSKKDFNVDVNKEDTILTLSSCANNNKYRVVLHAKKI